MYLADAFHAALADVHWGRATGGHVWALIADSTEWNPWRDQAWQMLDGAERSRVERMRSLEARETLVIAYALHRLLLGRFLDMPAQSVPVWRDSLGCPRVGEGLASASLSHAGTLIALAAGPSRPLGVDIEPASRATVMAEIAESICQPAELDAILALPAGDRAPALLSLWTRKEAILKALGIGFSQGDMTGFAVPTGGGEYLHPSGERLRMTSLNRNIDWVAALASAPGDSVEFFGLTPPRGPVPA